MNLPGFKVAMVKTRRQARSGLKLQVRAISLAHRVLLTRTREVDALANQFVTLAALPLNQALQPEGLLLVGLTLTHATVKRILPASWGENCVALLPGARCEMSMRYPKRDGVTPHVRLRGWNVAEDDIH